MRNILSHDEAKQIFEPHTPKIVDAFQQAFADFQHLVRATTEKIGFVEYSRRLKATLLHDLLKHRIGEAFRDVEEVKAITANKIFGLKLGDNLFIRVKKFNPDYSVAGIPTKQFKKFEKQQLSLEGLPVNPTLLTVGYIPNKTWTQIEGIYIACRLAGSTQWVEPLLGGTSMVQLQLPLVEPVAPTTESRVRVKLNEPREEKTGTDS